MRLKATPSIGPRYWTAMAIASLCGANLGDIVMDILKLGVGAGLASLLILFGLLLVMERAVAKEREAFYWGAILIVRAMATNIADYAVKEAHLTYAGTSLVLLLVLIACVTLDSTAKQGTKIDTLQADTMYWLTMLVAGTLGTLIADGLGHSFGPVQTGVPIAATMATIALLSLMAAWPRLRATGIVRYWIALVAIRWWGTNVGDIVAYLLSLPVSTEATGATLIVLLLLWRTERPGVATPRAG